MDNTEFKYNKILLLSPTLQHILILRLIRHLLLFHPINLILYHSTDNKYILLRKNTSDILEKLTNTMMTIARTRFYQVYYSILWYGHFAKCFVLFPNSCNTNFATGKMITFNLCSWFFCQLSQQKSSLCA